MPLRRGDTCLVSLRSCTKWPASVAREGAAPRGPVVIEAVKSQTESGNVLAHVYVSLAQLPDRWQEMLAARSLHARDLFRLSGVLKVNILKAHRSVTVLDQHQWASLGLGSGIEGQHPHLYRCAYRCAGMCPRRCSVCCVAGRPARAMLQAGSHGAPLPAASSLLFRRGGAGAER